MPRPMLAAAIAWAALVAPAAHAQSPVVLELFTSQGCSSCPPADALLTRLATRPGLLALDLHVTYWDRLGWKDPFSLPAVTARQREYAARLGRSEIYTPQIVAGGRHQAVGSDRDAVLAAIAAARADLASAQVSLALRVSGKGLVAQAGPGTGHATLIVIGFDPRQTTSVAGGENGGRQLIETNVVRAIAPVASWSGAALSATVARPPGQRAAVLLQAGDGRILGAAVLP